MMSDWELLENARRGDESAWRELIRKHHADLFRMTSLMTGSQAVAADLTQETFVRLLRQSIRHRSGQVKSLLTTIAFRLAVKESERRKRHVSLDIAGHPATDASTLDDLIREEKQRHTARAIQALPDDQKQILVLRFYGERRYEEIAELLNLPLGTIKSRIFYAVQAVRRKLQEEGVLE